MKQSDWLSSSEKTMKTDRSSKTTVSHYETKKEVHRMTFLSPYVPPVAQVV